MNIRIILTILSTILSISFSGATPYNIAPKAQPSASSSMDGFDASHINDGIIRQSGRGEWVSNSDVTFWGEINYPWIQLDWAQPIFTNKVIIYDRPTSDCHAAGGRLIFSDGSSVSVCQIPRNGAPKVVEFPTKQTEWIRFEVTDGDGHNLGLSEIEVYPSPESYEDIVSWVDPYIETTRGRYFFFVTGSQPYGMIGAAPLTRNKNQDGGGYNYNSESILGFPQIHGWMLSGLDMMPVASDTDPTLGEQGWKSRFSHDGEIVQPAYHRLYLDRYNVWVEQTATDRTSIYRLTYTQDSTACILLNLGGYLSTTTMVNAHAQLTSDRRITGYFDTTGRLWGGPDNVRIFFVAEFDRPIDRMDGWVDCQRSYDISFFEAPTIATPRNEGMSYSDAPSAGIATHFNLPTGTPLHVRMAISYVSIDNAEENLAQSDTDDWDFDRIRADSQHEWNEYLSRIIVKGGSNNDRTKFYTDLWHVLLGRHKIDDHNGQYPDYTTGGTRNWKYTIGAPLKVRELPRDKNGNIIHHMYNSDALWLSQWNLNSLWGIAYPEILDDFAASFIQYSLNGGLLARGPNAGGYSFIMSGCPATSLITSAYQRGICHKWNPSIAFREMKRNHMKGGMLAIDQDADLEFYINNGYCPDRAGLTIQWAFEDWALSQMAARMGKKRDAAYFNRRSSGWEASFHPELKLILPRRADGSWLHTNPLDGWGYEEANAWQATFGLSHAIPRLAELMGGNDSLCSKLNYAFEQSTATDFVTGYGSGYVSYANQPGLSNAHVFSHAGRLDLSQYWVRRVKDQAYGATSPDSGYGGHDEDQGQMGALSALMAIGLFSIDGGSSQNPSYDITSPIFDEIIINLHPEYNSGKQFRIVTHNNTPTNCYINRILFNNTEFQGYSLPHSALSKGGTLDIHLSNMPKHQSNRTKQKQ